MGYFSVLIVLKYEDAVNTLEVGVSDVLLSEYDIASLYHVDFVT